MKWLICICRRLKERFEPYGDDDVGGRKDRSAEETTAGDAVLLCSTALGTPCNLDLAVKEPDGTGWEGAYGDWLDTAR
jgi:hypothetical protein